jgi:hypothetical protein
MRAIATPVPTADTQAKTPRLCDSTPRRRCPRLHPLPCQQARLRRVRAQSEMLPGTADAQGHAVAARRSARSRTRYREHSRVPRVTSSEEEGRDSVRAPEVHPKARPLAFPRPLRLKRRFPPSNGSPKPPRTRKIAPDPGRRNSLRRLSTLLSQSSAHNIAATKTDFFNRIANISAVKSGPDVSCNLPYVHQPLDCSIWRISDCLLLCENDGK